MNKIILALDTTDLKEAIEIASKIKNKIYTIKLGLEFFLFNGKEGIKKFNEIGITNLMLDLKLKDIPDTVYKAIKTLNDIDFGYITIHGQGGRSMLDKAKKAASEIKSKPKIMIRSSKKRMRSLKNLNLMRKKRTVFRFRFCWLCLQPPRHHHWPHCLRWLQHCQYCY